MSKKKNPFESFEFQKAALCLTLPKDKGWFTEIKYDGYRIGAVAECGTVKLITRNGKDFTAKLPVIEKELNLIHSNGKPFILDGEAVVTDKSGKTDFQALQNTLGEKNVNKIKYFVFDILSFDGEDLRNEPLYERKKILKNLLENANPPVYESSYVTDNIEKSFALAKKLSLEGIITKRKDSTYNGNRDGSWLKIKCYMRQEFVICGYTVSEKEKVLSALIVGVYDGAELVYSGMVGTGFNQALKKELVEKMTKLLVKKPPFNKGYDKSLKDTFFVQPKLVAEVQFAEWTNENHLRQASFKGLRIDKDAKQVVRES